MQNTDALSTVLARSWLVPVFAISDLELMQTAGMDSLMLNWTNSLGIQIFGPLTILGMAARESPQQCHQPCNPRPVSVSDHVSPTHVRDQQRLHHVHGQFL